MGALRSISERPSQGGLGRVRYANGQAPALMSMSILTTMLKVQHRLMQRNSNGCSRVARVMNQTYALPLLGLLQFSAIFDGHIKKTHGLRKYHRTTYCTEFFKELLRTVGISA